MLVEELLPEPAATTIRRSKRIIALPLPQPFLLQICPSVLRMSSLERSSAMLD
jgi:hypothetical protein